jgi:hypothetical protein
MTTLKQAAKIERRVRRHAELTAFIQSHGVDRDTASKMAYQLVVNEQ